ncbi:hypothetical protein FKM82_027501 [Ascaphus truei]
MSLGYFRFPAGLAFLAGLALIGCMGIFLHVGWLLSFVNETQKTIRICESIRFVSSCCKSPGGLFKVALARIAEQPVSISSLKSLPDED